MVNPFTLVPIWLGVTFVAKGLLVAHWSRSLHRRHGSRYTYSTIFWRLLFSRPREVADWAVGDEDLSKDVKQVLEWNDLFNIISLGLFIAMLLTVKRTSPVRGFSS